MKPIQEAIIEAIASYIRSQRGKTVSIQNERQENGYTLAETHLMETMAFYVHEQLGERIIDLVQAIKSKI